MDRTLILVKPDAFERGLTGEIIARFERKGLRIAAMRHMTVDRGLAEQHYAEHVDKPFFGDLVDFITGGPLVALVLEGFEAVTAARQVIGATNPLEAAPGSIRGDHGLEVQTNLVHGSDSAESADARDRALLPGPLMLLSSRRAHRSDGRSWSSSGSSSPWRSPIPTSYPRATPRRVVVENARRKARSVEGDWCSGRTPPSCSTAACSASLATRRRRRGSYAGFRVAVTRCTAASASARTVRSASPTP